MLAPSPVFHSLVAGHSTLAAASFSTKSTSGSASSSARRSPVRLPASSSSARASLSRSAFASALPPWMPRSGHQRRLLLLQRIQLVEQPRRRKSQRRARLARGPHVHQPLQRILALLDSQLVAQAAFLDRFRPAEAPALIADHRLHRREQLGRGHQPHRHPRPPEHRLDHLAVAEVRNDHAVLHRISAHNAAGRNLQVEDRIARRGELMHQLLGRRAPVEGAFVALLPESPRSFP